MPAVDPLAVLAGPVVTLPRFPLYLPLLWAGLVLAIRAPGPVWDAIRWGRRQLRLKDVLKALWMARRFQAGGIRLLHVHFAGEAAELAEIIRRAVAIPYLVTLHARDLFVPRPSFPTVLDQAQALLCISDFNRQYLARHFPELSQARVFVHPLGVELPEQALFQARTTDQPLRLLCVARLVEKKGHHTLLEAIAQLRAQGLPVHLTLLGDGPLRLPVQHTIARLQLTSCVQLEGMVTQEEVQRRYRRGVDVFVLPCQVAADGDQDGIPVALMEAMSYGVPVVSTPVSGIPELIQHNTNGLLVPPQDPSSLARALLLLARDVRLAEALGAAGRLTIARSFELNQRAAAVCDRLESILQSLSPPA